MENQEKLPKKEHVQGHDDFDDQKIPKKDWPIGHLPDPKTGGKPEESQQDDPNEGFEKSKGNGFDEWSVSWP